MKTRILSLSLLWTMFFACFHLYVAQAAPIPPAPIVPTPPPLQVPPNMGPLHIFDNSCLPIKTIFDSGVQDSLLVEQFDQFSHFFSMQSPYAEGRLTPAAEGMLPSARCALATTDVCFYYNDGSDENTTACLSRGETVTLGSSWKTNFKASSVDNTLCVQAQFPLGWMTVGCKHRSTPELNPYAAPCYLSGMCTDAIKTESKALFPLSSMVVACLKDTLSKIFQDTRACAGSRLNLLPAFQEGIRRAVMGALALYVIIFGFKVMLGKEVPKKEEIFFFILKMILVIYFSVGFYKHIPNSGKVEYNHGVTFLFESFTGAADSFNNMVMRAGSANGLCHFPSSLYSPDYRFLSTWDALDCRIAYYLGMMDPTLVSKILLSFIPLFLAFEIVFLIFSIIFLIFIVAVTIELVSFMAAALIAMALVLYMAPLFVPLCLFKPTQSYFDSWKRLLIGYTLQPTIVIVFIAFMLTIFDNMVYATCEFTASMWSVPDLSTATSSSITFRNIPLFTLRPPSGTGAAECLESLGSAVAMLGLPSSYVELDMIFFKYVAFNSSSSSLLTDYLPSLLSACLFGYLFYHFMGMITGFAADLVGGGNLGEMSISFKRMIDKQFKQHKQNRDAKRAQKKAEGGGAKQNRGGGPKAGG